MRKDDPQHYPFETLQQIVQTYGEVGHHLDDGLKKLIDDLLGQLANYARRRVGLLPSVYQKNKAQSALDKISSRF